MDAVPPPRFEVNAIDLPSGVQQAVPSAAEVSSVNRVSTPRSKSWIQTSCELPEPRVNAR